jgi:hypothetical protein
MIENSNLNDVERLLPILHSTDDSYSQCAFKLYLPRSLKAILDGEVKTDGWRQYFTPEQGAKSTKLFTHKTLLGTSAPKVSNASSEKFDLKFVSTVEKLGNVFVNCTVAFNSSRIKGHNEFFATMRIIVTESRNREYKMVLSSMDVKRLFVKYNSAELSKSRLIEYLTRAVSLCRLIRTTNGDILAIPYLYIRKDNKYSRISYYSMVTDSISSTGDSSLGTRIVTNEIEAKIITKIDGRYVIIVISSIRLLQMHRIMIYFPQSRRMFNYHFFKYDLFSSEIGLHSFLTFALAPKAQYKRVDLRSSILNKLIKSKKKSLYVAALTGNRFSKMVDSDQRRPSIISDASPTHQSVVNSPSEVATPSSRRGAERRTLAQNLISIPDYAPRTEINMRNFSTFQPTVESPTETVRPQYVSNELTLKQEEFGPDLAKYSKNPLLSDTMPHLDITPANVLKSYMHYERKSLELLQLDAKEMRQINLRQTRECILIFAGTDGLSTREKRERYVEFYTVFYWRCIIMMLRLEYRPTALRVHVSRFEDLLKEIVLVKEFVMQEQLWRFGFFIYHKNEFKMGELEITEDSTILMEFTSLSKGYSRIDLITFQDLAKRLKNFIHVDLKRPSAGNLRILCKIAFEIIKENLIHHELNKPHKILFLDHNLKCLLVKPTPATATATTAANAEQSNNLDSQYDPPVTEEVLKLSYFNSNMSLHQRLRSALSLAAQDELILLHKDVLCLTPIVIVRTFLIKNSAEVLFVFHRSDSCNLSHKRMKVEDLNRKVPFVQTLFDLCLFEEAGCRIYETLKSTFYSNLVWGHLFPETIADYKSPE